MADELVPPEGETPLEQLVRHTREAALAQVAAILDQQREAFLRSSHGVLVETVEAVVARYGLPLEGVRAALFQTLDEVVQRHAAPLFAQLRQALLDTVSEVHRQQMEPFLQRGREFVLELAGTLIHTHTAPLVEQVRAAFLDAMNQMQERHLQPFHERTQALLGQLPQAFQETLFTHAPRHLSEVGYRLLDFALAATLFCLAAVFVPLGIVDLLNALRVPMWCAEFTVGLFALVVGLIFYRRRLKKHDPKPQAK